MRFILIGEPRNPETWSIRIEETIAEMASNFVDYEDAHTLVKVFDSYEDAREWALNELRIMRFANGKCMFVWMSRKNKPEENYENNNQEITNG